MGARIDHKCLGTICPLIEASVPSDRPIFSASTYAIMSKDLLYCRMPWAVPIARKLYHRNESNGGGVKLSRDPPLDLRRGDLVEVKGKDQIEALLDKNGKTRGLRFMPEMWQFCGKQYKVFKKIEKIKIEETGEIPIIKSPTFFLDGVYCDGGSHGDCDRSCFLFWKEDWLSKVEQRD
jgi:hypothetical protein